MKTTGLKGLVPVAAALAACTLVLVPGATSATGVPYSDATGDSNSAPDITGIVVASDKASGQLLFRIMGTNLSTSSNTPTFLDIDSDANPLTGDVASLGADYEFGITDTSYYLGHWDGSQWVEAPTTTVRVTGGGAGLLVSVNKSELGNTSDFNFSVDTVDVANKQVDSAPDDGMFNYSLDAAGPSILSLTLQTTPSSGPKAGGVFVVAPTGLKLPPNGATVPQTPKPDTYACQAKLKGNPIVGSGTGGCTFRLGKKTHKQVLNVVVTVTYEGATKSVPFTFKVA